MSSDSIEMDWLDKSHLNSVAALRFAKFCQQDIAEYDDPDDPDKALYREAANLVLQRLDQAVSGERK